MSAGLSKSAVYAAFALAIISIAIGLYGLSEAYSAKSAVQSGTLGVESLKSQIENLRSEIQSLRSEVPMAKPANRAVTVVNEFIPSEQGPTNQFVPTTLVAHKGDEVALTIINRAPIAHGFSIDEYKVKQVLGPKDSVTIHFTANQSGIFRMYCQLHPAHLPGWLVVLG